ncbi:MAG: 4Fe-4S dicluster domain-containing protein [Candidatus Woesearchaeota archaeon]
MSKFLKKEDLPKFFAGLLKGYKVIAPVKKRTMHTYEIVDSFDQVDLDFVNTAYPIKRFFLPPKETLFEFAKGGVKAKLPDTKQLIFGVRPCDVNALKVIDRIFLDEHEDPYYKARRDNTVIIALNCCEAGPNCFGGSFGSCELKDGYDLLLTEIGAGFVVEVGSKVGEALAKDLENTNIKPGCKLTHEKEITQEMLDKLRASFTSQIWDDEAKKCLSCTACTATCPTCPCFFVRDECYLDLESGCRYRHTASCQLRSFTKVAGAAVFRKEYGAMFKHRIFHQLQYYKDKFACQMCVGCGRCFTNCPTKIDMIKILEKL